MVCVVCRVITGFGTGVVVMFTVIHTANEQFGAYTPYVLAIVKLDERPRMTAQVICEPKDERIGMRVKSAFRGIATDGESGIIHYGTKFVPVE